MSAATKPDSRPRVLLLFTGVTERTVLNWVARQPRIRLAEAKP